jgi:DNA polymerase III subunit alpha
MHTVLAAKSSFSIGESILSVDEVVEQAKAAGATAVALTDTMSVTALIDFSKACDKAGLKPIIGCRLRLVDDPSWRKTKEDKKARPEYFLTWYVLSEHGLKALFKLLTLANSEERFYFTSKLGFDDLYAALAKCSRDDVAIAISDAYSVLHHESAVDIASRIASLVSASNVFLGLTPINTPYWDTVNKKAIELAARIPRTDFADFPYLVVRPACYPKGDVNTLTVMNAVSRNVKMSETWVWAPVNSDLHAMTASEILIGECVPAVQRLMKRGLASSGGIFSAGVHNTKRLVDMVTYKWSKAPVSLPKMAEDEFAALVDECKCGFAARFGRKVFDHQPSPDELRDVYIPRLKYEMEVLKKLGFSGYFLLVQDIVRYAKMKGILVGPGRGSVGGSLVAYLMGITDCDPLRFDLLFERFINPDRLDLPDADLDFMSERRGEIVQYLVEKYGKDRVAGISNFNSLAAASAIRDVGKAFGLSEGEYRCSKLVAKEHGANVPLPKQIEKVPEIAEFARKYAPYWNIMTKVEGAIKSMGRHAAGVVVGGCDLVDRAVVERRKDGATVNWDKRVVEEQGLVKVDILGLETLDLIKKALDYIEAREGERPDLMRISLNDVNVLANFAAGKTVGIFQFESGGMRRLLKELGKDTITFDDITAATALYRPGPMESGMMDSYWKRKQGLEAVEYDHPLMEPILAPTFGVMVYQEQVMQVSRVIAGYSAAGADKLRKIMGKKLPEEMAKERGKFVEGCVKTVGCTEEWAGDLFDKIEGFAGYGFNKSHSVEYTLISYQSMYLKTYHRLEFYAAALSLMKEDKLAAILKDAAAFGIKVMMPDINFSTGQFEIVDDETIHEAMAIPFNRIKGISSNTTDAILKAREAGPFTSKADFIARVQRQKCNVRHQELLDKVGAFARIEAGQLPPDHPDRIRDQRDLIPGLISSTVPIYRAFSTDSATKTEVVKLVANYIAAKEEDEKPVKPLLGKDAKFMAIFDAPTRGEEEVSTMTCHDNFVWTLRSSSGVGYSRSDAYWTALIKEQKLGKQVSPDETKKWAPVLEREIEILKPPVIVLLGSAIVRHFFPDLKGKASESAGKVVYSKDLDANLVIGFNPAEIYYDPDKQTLLDEVFAAVAGILE